jgi:transketolase
MHTINPINADEAIAAASETAAVMTVEEHNVTGGLGSAVAEVLLEVGAAIPSRRHGVPDGTSCSARPPLYAHYSSTRPGS